MLPFRTAGQPCHLGTGGPQVPSEGGEQGVSGDKPVLSVGLATWVEVHTGLPEQGLAEALRAQQESMM